METQTRAQLRVAILEEERVLLETLAEALERAGVQVLKRSTTPEDFLDAVRADPPSVAIIDLKVQQEADGAAGRGLAVLLQLRQSVPEVRALILSATRERGMVEQCFNAGASAYLFKQDAGKQELLSALAAVARGERLFPATRLPQNVVPAVEARPAPLQALSSREHEVLTFVVSGVDNLKISAHLGIAERTVKAHLSSLYRKLNCENRTQLALKGRELGVLPRRDL